MNSQSRGQQAIARMTAVRKSNANAVRLPYLRAWRVFRGLKQDSLAELTKLHVATLTALENGKKPAHPSTCKLLSLVLGVTPDDLQGRPPEGMPEVENPRLQSRNARSGLAPATATKTAKAAKATTPGKPVFVESGKRGGATTARRHGAEHYARIGRLGNASKARRSKQPESKSA